MGPTVTEKEHWKERIERRINKRIETVWASDPNLKERIDGEARRRALDSLKLADLERENEELEVQKKELDTRQLRITRQKLAVVRGVPVDAVDISSVYHADREVEQAVERRRTVFERQLLADHEVGRQIVTLQDEKQNLLDTIWLATSPSQPKLLWTKVTEILQEATTDLEQEALTIPPIDPE